MKRFEILLMEWLVISRGRLTLSKRVVVVVVVLCVRGGGVSRIRGTIRDLINVS